MTESIQSPGRILILGAGPTGLGTAYRLQELGYTDFAILERESYPGGLAASFTDEHGFTWDIGGHVQFSHYEYFDKLMDKLLPNDWLDHERESWVWIADRFVPYPFQYNIRHLPQPMIDDCIAGLEAVQNQSFDKPRNFDEWILQGFGEGLARIFMRPYNYKVWAYPPARMSYSWIGERVATIDLERLKGNIANQRDDISWGPNNTFRFPVRGGTGEIWRRLAARIEAGPIHYNGAVTGLDVAGKTVMTADGLVWPYDTLISTIPLDTLAAMSGRAPWQAAAEKLCYSTVHIFGFGLRGQPPASLTTKCWMYFPEDDNPFFRATVFSNYSPNNVPDIDAQWSLMVEVSESPMKAVDRVNLVEEAIQGCLNTKLIQSRDEIVDTWSFVAAHGYPTPSLARDEALEVLLPAFEAEQIYSRGRFGAWKYEVANQDHALMQGVELANRLILGETEETVWHPEIVNRRPK